MLSGPDVVVVLAIAIIVFGGKRISDLGVGLGKGIRNFKKSMEGDNEDIPKKSEDKS
jgi:sec-independent protein translocase protein TatA